jgi:Cof subfamily protein (haloacid dehalogenase superfamily)
LLLSDVDGTLVTSAKSLTPASIEAVQRLNDAGIIFAITSARPPQGLSMFVEPLKLSTPLAAFNGGMLVDQELRIIEEKVIRENLTQPIIDLLISHQQSVWVYQGTDWYVLDESGHHVSREASICGCEPTALTNFRGVDEGVAKIVGVSDDTAAIAGAASAMSANYGRNVSVTRSQSYYLDITHPDANKGNVVKYLSSLYDIDPSEIATIGDMHNDVSMFEVSGFSIAMGNAEPDVKDAAKVVTDSNDAEGFAHAITNHILG